MSSQQANTTNDTISTVTLPTDEVPAMLELCVRHTLYAGRRQYSLIITVTKDNAEALEDGASEVHKVLSSVVYNQLKMNPATECNTATSNFVARVKRVEKKRKTRIAVNRLFGIKASLESNQTDMEDMESDEVQAKLREVEQILGKKRKTGEVTGNAGGS